MSESNARDQEPNAPAQPTTSLQPMGAMPADDPHRHSADEVWIQAFTVEDVEPHWPLNEHFNTRFTPSVICKILNNIANCGVKYIACMSEGVSYGQFGRIKRESKGIKELMDEAMEIYREKIQHAVHCRAINGWYEPIYWKGEYVGEIRKFSDRLLELHAKRHIEAYRDKNTTDLNVRGGIIVLEQPMDEDEWAKSCPGPDEPKRIESTVVEKREGAAGQ